MVSKKWMIVNSEMEWMWKERDVAYSKVHPSIWLERLKKL
jgi:hypothetical protein